MRHRLTAPTFAPLTPNSTNSEHGEEFRRLLRAIRNNCPGLLEEMEIGPGGQKLLRKRAPADVEGGFLRIGPLVHSHMQVFAVKLGFALWFETTKRAVPLSGGVVARWFSNVDAWEGLISPSLFEILGDPKTLRQGMKHAAEQFSYVKGFTADGRFGAFFSAFRGSFAVLNIVSDDASRLHPYADHPLRLYRPGEFIAVP